MSQIAHEAAVCNECPVGTPSFVSVFGLNQHRRNHDLCEVPRTMDRYYSWNVNVFCVYEDWSSCREYVAYGCTGHYGFLGGATRKNKNG